METIEKKLSRHDKKFRYAKKSPVCKVEWTKCYMHKTDFAFMGSVLLGSYCERKEFYLNRNEKFQVFLAVPNAHKYVSTREQAIKAVEESFIYFNDSDIEMSRIPKSKTDWSKEFHYTRHKDKEGSLMKFDSGEFIDVYSERAKYEFELFKSGNKDFKMIDHITSASTKKKTGMVGWSECESSKPLNEIYKLLDKIYPKRDYLGRHVTKGDSIENKKIQFSMTGVASKDFEKKLRTGISQIAKKYKLKHTIKVVYGEDF